MMQRQRERFVKEWGSRLLLGEEAFERAWERLAEGLGQRFDPQVEEQAQQYKTGQRNSWAELMASSAGFLTMMRGQVKKKK